MARAKDLVVFSLSYYKRREGRKSRSARASRLSKAQHTPPPPNVSQGRGQIARARSKPAPPPQGALTSVWNKLPLSGGVCVLCRPFFNTHAERAVC